MEPMQYRDTRVIRATALLRYLSEDLYVLIGLCRGSTGSLRRSAMHRIATLEEHLPLNGSISCWRTRSTDPFQ